MSHPNVGPRRPAHLIVRAAGRRVARRPSARPAPLRARPGLRLGAGAVLAGLAAAVVVLPLQPAGAAEPVQARNADSFVETIGVNTHFGYWDTVYGSQYAGLKDKLVRSGIRYVRDGGSNAMGRLAELHESAGVRANLIVARRAGGSWANPLDQGQIGPELAEIGRRMPGAVVSLENPNEYDISHGANEKDWVGRIRSYCKALYAEAKADPALQGVPVLGPSLTSGGAYQQVGDLSSCLDRTNAHPYGGGRHPESQGWGADGYGSVDWTFRQLDKQSADEPAQFTEAGYHNALNSTTGHVGTPEEVDAKYTTRMYLQNFDRGVERTFKYEFVDEGRSATNPEAAFGFLRNDLSEKPSYVAVRNLIGLLGDRGCTKTPSSLEYGLTGDTTDVRQLLLQKCDGSFYLVLWQAKQSYDVDAKKVYGVPDRFLTLTLTQAADISTARPLTSGSLTAGGTDTRQVVLSVPDHPLVVRIGAAPTQPSAPSAAPASPSASGSPSGSPAPAPGWALNGSAARAGTAIRLTEADNGQAGSAILSAPVNTASLRVGFDAEFTGGTGGDGMALALWDADQPATTLGGAGGNLGLPRSQGLAVTFDTYRNQEDPSGNLVGLIRTDRDGRTYLDSTTDIPNLRTGTHHVEVAVDVGRIRVILDGRTVLDAAAPVPAVARLGFTAATGGLDDRHSILNVRVIG